MYPEESEAWGNCKKTCPGTITDMAYRGLCAARLINSRPTWERSSAHSMLGREARNDPKSVSE